MTLRAVHALPATPAEWWTVFVEKYGGAFLYGKYPNNAGEAYKAELLSALEKMISDAVAIAPEGSEITIDALAKKGSVSNVHAEYITMANAEISKAILGQTLTTEIGDTGSYAAAKTHNMVREDLAAADLCRIAMAFNRLASIFTFYNFGDDVVPSLFQFVKDEDLQTERAERDARLYAIGWRPKKSYIAREYGIPEDDFDLASSDGSQAAFSRSLPQQTTGFRTASAVIPESEHPEDCDCGCQSLTIKPPLRIRDNRQEKKSGGLFGFLPRLFMDKEDRSREKDDRLTGDFEASLLKRG